MARLSLAQQIALLDDTAPVDFDIEDAHLGADPDDESDKPDEYAAREHYIDVGPSSLRKLHDSVSDPKYDGVTTTRKQLLEASEDEEAEEGPDGSESSESHDSGAESQEDEDVPSESEAIPVDQTEKDDASGQPNSPPVQEPGPDAVGMSSTLQKSRDDDRRKGKAIAQQLALWDSLLDARIRLQKAIISSNKLPTPLDTQMAIKSDDSFRSSLHDLLSQAALLNEELSQLQTDLLLANTDSEIPPRKRSKIDSLSETSDFEGWFKEATEDASALEHAIHPYQLQTLSKWSSKIQAVAPSVLLPSNRNAFSKNRQNLKSVIQLIDDTLTTDHDKLLARTQTRRTKGARLGHVAPVDLGTGDGDQEHSEAVEDGDAIDTELFDDADFYQQLLRDIIDARGNNGGADDWLAIQKQKKAKKKVDTKASKGRKLRYEVHEKIQNFMVPVPLAGAWHEEQIDELFASLLGKGFENFDGSNAQADIPELGIEAGKHLQEQADASLRRGFRVFG